MLDVMMAEDFPKLMTDPKPQIQEAQRTSDRSVPKKNKQKNPQSKQTNKTNNSKAYYIQTPETQRQKEKS